MAARPVGKPSPLKQGLIFAAIMFVGILIWAILKVGTINIAVITSTSVGAVVGGLVYGFIGWLRYRN